MSGRDVLPTINLEVLVFSAGVGTILHNEKSFGKLIGGWAVGDSDAVGVVDIVDFAGFGVDGQNEIMRGPAVVDFEPVTPLAGSDQIAAAVAGIIDGQPFDVGLEAVIADLCDECAFVAAVGLRAEFPNAGCFFGDEENTQLIVGHTAFGGGFELQLAHLCRRDGAGLFTQQILFDRAIFVIDEEVILAAAGTVIGAASVGCAAFEDLDDAVGGDVGKVAGNRVDGPDFDARRMRAARAGDGQVGGHGVENKAIEDIDVIRLASGGDHLVLRAVDVVSVQAALFVSAEDEALGGIYGIDPDCGIIGGITLMRDGIGLRAGLGSNHQAIAGIGGDEQGRCDGDAEAECEDDDPAAHNSPN